MQTLVPRMGLGATKSDKKPQAKKSEYSQTCNLFHPKFPLRASGDPNSFDALSYWEQIDLSSRACNLNSGAEAFVLHDGPPYANGSLHLGTLHFL